MGERFFLAQGWKALNPGKFPCKIVFYYGATSPSSVLYIRSVSLFEVTTSKTIYDPLDSFRFVKMCPGDFNGIYYRY